MFGKTFASMYTGSMCGAGMHVFAVWNYAIANADAKGFVELNPRHVGMILGGPPADAQKALEYLEQPDPGSRNQDEEGRRIVREGQFLYRIVSHQRYMYMRDMVAKRDYDREYRRKQRGGTKSSDDNTTSSQSSDDNTTSSQSSDDRRPSSHIDNRQKTIDTDLKESSNINNLSNGSLFDDPEGPVSKVDEEKAVKEVFDYYLQRTDRNPNIYTLTKSRKQKGIARLRECLKKKDGNLENAIGLMKATVDRLANSDWHMGRDPETNGRRYCEWEDHLFKSYERMEKWWNR